MAPKKPAAKKPKASLDARIRTDAALRKRVLSNPGLRSKLSASSLQKYAPAQAKARALSVRLNAPITPGSSTTERDLAHEAQAATTVKYGGALSDAATNVGIGQQTQRDTGALYDQYRAALQQHTANIQAFQAGAQQALQNTQAGITGLGQQQATDMQAQANAGAAQQGVAQAGNLAPLADQALGVRQQLAGTFGAQQAMTGAAANTYADTQANVVAPGQKLTALNQQAGKVKDLRTKQQALKTEAAAYNQTFRDTRRQDEFKNVLAQQTLGVKAAGDAADAAAKAAANDPTIIAAKTSATEEAKQAAKYGMSVHQWRVLGPKGRAQRIGKKSKTAPGSDVITSGPLAGKTKKWVAAHPDEASTIVTKYNADGPGKRGKTVEPATQAKRDFRTKYGVDLQPTSAHNTVVDQVSQAQNVLKNSGKKGPRGVITTGQLVQAMTQGGEKGIPKLPAVVIRAALDIVRYGHITGSTAARLHKRGYSVASLGFKTGPATRPGASAGTGGRPTARPPGAGQ